MNYWLIKSEPFKYSWDTFVKDGKTFWDGVRNYAARNNLKAMKKGDLVFWDTGQGKGHCGVVIVDSPDALVTIEGNTGKQGGRNGDGVYVKQRPINGGAKWSLLGFARPIVKEENEIDTASV